MTEAEFGEWLKRMGYSHADAAVALGVSVGVINRMATGRRRIKRYEGMACYEIERKAGGKPPLPLRAPPPPWASNDLAAVEARLAAAEANLEAINGQIADLWLISGILLKRIATKGRSDD